MELLLNLVWLVISAALGVLLLTTRSKCQAASKKLTYKQSTAWICYLVLIALLLPAISMTDDLMAMVAPTDGEQIARRHEVSTGGQHHSNLHVALFHIVRQECAPPVWTTGLETGLNLPVLPSAFQRHTQGRAPPSALQVSWVFI